MHRLPTPGPPSPTSPHPGRSPLTAATSPEPGVPGGRRAPAPEGPAPPRLIGRTRRYLGWVSLVEQGWVTSGERHSLEAVAVELDDFEWFQGQQGGHQDDPSPRGVVDEVVQETFILAFEAIDRFEWKGEASFLAWLSRIARNVSIDRAKDSRRSRYLELPDRLPARGASPSRIMRRGERLDRLEKAIADLPADYREVIRLSQLDGLKVKEIARRMNRSEYAVKHLMARALCRLRESFGDTESLSLPDRPLQVEGGNRVEQ